MKCISANPGALHGGDTPTNQDKTRFWTTSISLDKLRHAYLAGIPLGLGRVCNFCNSRRNRLLLFSQTCPSPEGNLNKFLLYIHEKSGLVKLFSIDFVVIQARPHTAPRVDISCRFNGFVCPSFGARSVKHVSSFSWPAHLRKSHSNQVKRDCL